MTNMGNFPPRYSISRLSGPPTPRKVRFYNYLCPTKLPHKRGVFGKDSAFANPARALDAAYIEQKSAAI